MPSSFSNRDIEEAKRRVREMQEKANRYVAAGRNEPKAERKTSDIPPIQNKARESEQKTETKQEPKQGNETKDEDEPLGDSFNLILLLLMLLSHEGADRKLLLALLYLLF